MAKVKKVSAEIVRPLRHKVLRPSLPFESSIMDLDDHDYTFHFCVKEEFRIISVASVYHESFVELPKKDAYRLRGMATEPSEQGKGYGKMVLNGVIDYLAIDEEEATSVAKKLLSYFQGTISEYSFADQSTLKDIIPDDRRWAYPIREIIEILADTNTFLELRKNYGRSIVTGFIRIEGQPIALLASDCQQMGGAIDSEAAEKSADFLSICNDHSIPTVVLVDTPGFMVGPDSEEQGAVKRMANLFKVGSKLDKPVIAIFLRKGYGLGAQALVGGSLHNPVYTCLLYTSPSPRDGLLSRMPSSA